MAQNRAFCPQQIHDDSAWYEHMVRTSASVPEDVWNAPPFADNPAVEKRDIPSVAELTATCRDFPYSMGSVRQRLLEVGSEPSKRSLATENKNEFTEKTFAARRMCDLSLSTLRRTQVLR